MVLSFEFALYFNLFHRIIILSGRWLLRVPEFPVAIPVRDRVILKTLKMVTVVPLLSTQH